MEDFSRIYILIYAVSHKYLWYHIWKMTHLEELEKIFEWPDNMFTKSWKFHVIYMYIQMKTN